MDSSTESTARVTYGFAVIADLVTLLGQRQRGQAWVIDPMAADLVAARLKRHRLRHRQVAG